MNWKDVSKVVGGIAPMVGTLLGGPVGGATGALVAKALGCDETPEAVSQAIRQDPDAYVKIKKIESDEKISLAEIGLKHNAAVIESGSTDMQTVNLTMQEETKSDKWWVSGWRPYNGFLFGTTMFCVYFVLPLLFGLIKAFADSKPDLTVPKIDYWVWLAWASVLGVTSWHRGMKQRLDSGEVGQPGIMGAIVNRIKR